MEDMVMAENAYNPTAANILSSLRIKGASVKGGPGMDGHVPVLDENGRLDPSTLDLDRLAQLLDVPALAKVAFVDPNSRAPASERNGSIAAPFISLQEAAAAFVPGSSAERFRDFVLMPGDYRSEAVSVQAFLGQTVTLTGIAGAAATNFTSLSLTGHQGMVRFYFRGLSIASLTIYTVPCFISATGGASIHSVVTVGMSGGAVVRANMGADSTVASTDPRVVLEYLDVGNKVRNEGTTVPGATVADAIESLASRKIKIPVFTADSAGIHADSDDFEDVSVPEGGDTHVITRIGVSLASAANEVFHKDGDSPTYGAVAAQNVAAGTLTSEETVAMRLKLGEIDDVKAILTVDSDDFLVISEQSS